eukprot:CAMPEP_0116017668 /NCGR_PEP_ID=MMETSP0321-20121206/8185_1 /TAXON_ID=163516 /ORGANISM="Leptocylindrus danicus var. danicus, Strain B650" /LENGTH=116 /DNA_ID=CAMNT_0003487905 /DNA_START=159 /DNA_END=509 /DNA_ORIENTATION=+
MKYTTAISLFLYTALHFLPFVVADNDVYKDSVEEYHEHEDPNDQRYEEGPDGMLYQEGIVHENMWDEHDEDYSEVIPFHESYADEETMARLEGDAYEEYMKALADHHGLDLEGSEL